MGEAKASVEEEEILKKARISNARDREESTILHDWGKV